MHLLPFSFQFFKNTIPIVGLTSALMLVMFHGLHIRGTQVHVPTPQIATTTPSLSNFWVYFATVGSPLILIEGTANCFKTSTVFATVSGMAGSLCLTSPQTSTLLSAGYSLLLLESCENDHQLGGIVQESFMFHYL